MIDIRRAAVIAEAESWLGTPFHHEGRVKGAGVDCLMLLAEVYERAGLIRRVEPGHYPPDWFMHRDVERYLAGVMELAREIDGPPQPGDVALFKWGRCFAHGAIVTGWPRMIHAYAEVGSVCAMDGRNGPFRNRPVRFFDPFERMQ